MADKKPKSNLPKVEIRSIKSIKFRDDNPREHSTENLHLIQQSIQRNKAGRSILIDENDESLAGEGTTRAALKAGIKEVIIVEASGDQLVAVKRTDLSEDQKKEMILFDNRANETSDWDASKTAMMLGRLKDIGLELPLFGFTEDDLEHFKANANFDEADLDRFFQVDDGGRSVKRNEIHLLLIFSIKEGKKILADLKKIDEKPETAFKIILDFYQKNQSK